MPKEKKFTTESTEARQTVPGSLKVPTVPGPRKIPTVPGSRKLIYQRRDKCRGAEGAEEKINCCENCGTLPGVREEPSLPPDVVRQLSSLRPLRLCIYLCADDRLPRSRDGWGLPRSWDCLPHIGGYILPLRDTNA